MRDRCDICGVCHTKRRVNTQEGGLEFVLGEPDATPTCDGHKVDGETGVRTACTNYPLRGGNVCRYHGGAAPQVRAANAERLRQRSMDEVLRFALAEVEDRHVSKSADEQLLEALGRSSQAVEWLAQRVAELDVPDPQNQGEFANLVGFDDEGDPVLQPPWAYLYGPDHNGDLAPHVLWGALDRERDRHAKLCKLAIDAGISERLVRLAETQAQGVVSVILKVLHALNLPPDELEAAKRVAATALRELGPVTVETTAR